MLWKLFASFAMIAAMTAVLPGSVTAHADFDRSLPEPDSVVEQAPSQVDIWFTEELAEGSTATVTGPDGARVDNDDAAIDLFDPERKHLTVTLMPDLPAGGYTVAWTSVSGEDDDTESGMFTFIISSSGTPVASPVASPSPAASPESTDETAVVTQTNTESATPNRRAFLIALTVAAGAAALIYGFWVMVRPRA